ncbi:hypothetical protein GALL_80100 [mine drainage metagenome]|uniref:PNPLA domain-containing protein n=1 Tax=mine drainage metagenome TaxID=410659 RepID=A0A1J5SNM1_9ZZZZ
MAAQIPLYPLPLGQALPADKPLAVCISGGGSRSMVCGLGQLSALASLDDPQRPGQRLLDRVGVFSSVSGGSWAAVPFTFLPATLGGQPVTDADLLITPLAPGDLVKGSPGEASPGNVCHMPATCLGAVPGRFDETGLADFALQWLWLKLWDKVPWSWLWIYAVGHFILRGYALYAATYSEDDGILPDKFFSLSARHVTETLLPGNPDLGTDDFYYPRAGRPALIVNFNLMEESAGAPQMPMQATCLSTGAPGQTPNGQLRGGGACESFGFGTTLLPDPAPAGAVLATLRRRYSLCDITGCSSAFFAQWLQQRLGAYLDQSLAEADSRPTKFGFAATQGALARAELTRLRAELAALDDKPLAIVPQYDYWPLIQTEPPVTIRYGFSDGGAFENTGLMGLLARTSGDVRALVFVNTSTALSLDGNGLLVADSQLPNLFGFAAYENGAYPSFGGMRADQPLSFVQLFPQAPFADLLAQLKRNSCAGTDSPHRGIAWARQTLTTVANPVAQVAAGRTVQVLWVYNNRVDQWQEAITDIALQADLSQGQGADPGGSLAHFPSYSTFDIHLDAEAANMLAQLSAWNVAQLTSEIAALLG